MVPQRKLAKDLSVFPTVALRKLGGVCVLGGGGGVRRKIYFVCTKAIS